MNIPENLKKWGASVAGLLTGWVAMHLIVTHWSIIKRWFS